MTGPMIDPSEPIDLIKVRERMVDLEDHHEREITVEQVIAEFLGYGGDPAVLGEAIRQEIDRTAILFERVYHRRLGLPMKPSTGMAVGFLQGITFATAYRQIEQGDDA